MVFDSNSVRKHLETLSLRYTNHSRMDLRQGIMKVSGTLLTPASFLALADCITNKDYGLKETFGEKGVQDLKTRLEFSALLDGPIDDEYKEKDYCNEGHFLCDILKMGTLPRKYYDALTTVVRKVSPGIVSLKEQGRSAYLPKFAIAIATSGSDLDAVIEILFGDQTLQVSTILIQESLIETFKMKLSIKCANFLENGYGTSYEAETLAVANEAKKMGAKVGEFKSSSNVMAFVYDLLPLKSFKLGNVLFIVPFRTASEAVKLAANVNYIAASVWGDSTTALSIAHGLTCANVWINCHGLTHPSVPLYPRPTTSVPKYDTRDAMIKLWKLPQLEPWHSLIRRWVIVPNRSLPNGRNLLVRHLGPVGTVSVPYRPSGTLKWLIPALACGNRAVIHFDQKDSEATLKAQALLATLITVIPDKLLALKAAGPDDNAFIFVNDRRIPFEDSPSDGVLLANFARTQYIWLGESQPL